jgi:hypothetical protein
MDSHDMGDPGGRLGSSFLCFQTGLVPGSDTNNHRCHYQLENGPPLAKEFGATIAALLGTGP